MLLSAFEKSVAPAILNRGQAYFNENRVHDLENNGTEWQANVEGTEDYFVEVTIKNNKIDNWQCDCPFDEEATCKHIVAVLLAIREENTIPISAEDKVEPLKTQKKAQPAPPKFDKLLKETPDKDLRDFVVQYAKHNKDFKDGFARFLALSASESNKEQYIVAIQSAIKSAADKYGYIDYQSLTKLGRVLKDFDAETKKALLAKDYLKTMHISMALFETITPILDTFYDNNYRLYSVVHGALNYFDVLLKKDVAPDLKIQLHEYLMQAVKKSVNTHGDILDMLMEILLSTITSPSREQTYFALLEELTELAIDEYAKMGFIRSRISLLDSKGRKDEARQLLYANLHFPEFRTQAITYAIDNNDLAIAKRLVKEGMDEMKKNKLWGIIQTWTTFLLAIAEKENHLLDIRLYSGQLLIDHRKGIDIFRKWKATFPSSEWEKAFEGLIKTIKRQPYAVTEQTWIDILIEEQRWDGLLRQMEGSNNIILMMETSKRIPKQYLTTAVSLIESTINKAAEYASSRTGYKDIATVLRLLKGVDEDTAQRMVNSYRTKYKQRPAMIEELAKL